MPWGDVWGSSPSEYHRKLAEAFFAGREFGTASKAQVIKHVEAGYGEFWMSYEVRGVEIARFTPEAMTLEIVAAKLAGELTYNPTTYPEMVVRTVYADKAEMRHLKALGVDAEWQWGGRPFLICGASADGCSEFRTLKKWSELPEWTEPKLIPKEPKPDRRFVNLTPPLFPEFA